MARKAGRLQGQCRLSSSVPCIALQLQAPHFSRSLMSPRWPCGQHAKVGLTHRDSEHRSSSKLHSPWGACASPHTWGACATSHLGGLCSTTPGAAPHLRSLCTTITPGGPVHHHTRSSTTPGGPVRHHHTLGAYAPPHPDQHYAWRACALPSHLENLCALCTLRFKAELLRMTSLHHAPHIVTMHANAGRHSCMLTSLSIIGLVCVRIRLTT